MLFHESQQFVRQTRRRSKATTLDPHAPSTSRRSRKMASRRGGRGRGRRGGHIIRPHPDSSIPEDWEERSASSSSDEDDSHAHTRRVMDFYSDSASTSSWASSFDEDDDIDDIVDEELEI